MTEEKSYHKAPHTLDPNREIPEDAPPSAGHEEEEAEAVRALDEEFTEGVEEEQERIAEEGEVGPRAAGDHAGEDSDDDDDSSAGTSSDQTSDDSDDVPDGTVQDVLDWVGDDKERAQRALDVERTGQNRSSLVSELEKRAA